MSREPTVDLDKQFQADLERAEALSLESLALEQFRNRKRLEESHKHVSREEAKPKIATVSRAFSFNDSESADKIQAKPRPRPGMPAGNPQVHNLIAPPPTVAPRRHSASTTPTPPPPQQQQVGSAWTEVDTEPIAGASAGSNDLISFTSPPVKNDIIEMCQQLHNWNKQISLPLSNMGNMSAMPAVAPQPPATAFISSYGTGAPNYNVMMPQHQQSPLAVVPPPPGWAVYSTPNAPSMMHNLNRPTMSSATVMHLPNSMRGGFVGNAGVVNRMPIGVPGVSPSQSLQAFPMQFPSGHSTVMGPQTQFDVAYPLGGHAAMPVSGNLPLGTTHMFNSTVTRSSSENGTSTDLTLDSGPPPVPPKSGPTPPQLSAHLKPRVTNSSTSSTTNRSANFDGGRDSVSAATAAPSTSSTSKSVRTHRRQTSNLIDLASGSPGGDRSSGGGGDSQNSVKVSILEAFDPLLCDASDYDNSSRRTLSPECSMYDSASVCGSVYDEYDPYDFIYTGSDSNSLSDPLYAAVAKSEQAPMSPPPPNLPPRPSVSTISREEKLLLQDSITAISSDIATRNSELNSFHRMVQDLRNQFKYNDPDTNMGFVISPMITHTYHEETSIKLAVHPHYPGADTAKPVYLTCDVNTSIEHITLQLTCDLEAPSTDQYTLKVWGYNEYLAPTSLLSDYEYVHNCIKLEQDVLLILIPDRLVDKSLARSSQDDVRDRVIKLQDLVPNEPYLPVSYDNLWLLLENLEKQMSVIIKAAEEIDLGNHSSPLPTIQLVKQSTMFIVNLMGELEILEITAAINNLDEVCRQFLPSNGEYRDTRSGKKFGDAIVACCTKIRTAIIELIRMYSRAFMVNFELKTPSLPSQPDPVPVTDINDYVVVRVCALYRPYIDWKFNDYMIAVQAFHGKRPLGHPVFTQFCGIELLSTKAKRISFDCWLDMQDIFVGSLARESRLVFVLYGRTLQPEDKDDKEATPRFKQDEIGWAAVQFFNYDGELSHGSMLLSLWPTESDFRYGPAPSPGAHPHKDHPIMGIEIVAGGSGPDGPSVIFPPIAALEANRVFPRGDFNTLDAQTREQLEQCVAQDTLSKIPVELREILWEKRHYMYDIPNALPRVLCCSHRWDWFCLADLHGMLKCWRPMEPVAALELLLPTFPDMEVRKLAVSWIRRFESDELVDYLPQLVVAYQHDTYHNSPLAKFLLERAMKRPRVAHYLFWLLCHSLPGYMPQNTDCVDMKTADASEFRHHRRTLLLLRSLLAICGEALRNCLISQQFLSQRLHEIAVEIQQETKDSQRMKRLHHALDELDSVLAQNPSALPLAPTLKVSGINVQCSSYFATNTVPLKISFRATDKSIMPAIFKVGDDLQQDHLTLQIIRIMNKLWLKEGLDLKMVTFTCIPTGQKRGIIEMVQKSETLRKIQVELGLTGSFKDKSIHEWLAKHNPSELEYARAVDNFTASCAGYCVVTYILGICDRHNDNIMLKTSGHMFHIDFGKFLGDAQMFGNFKRDRTPFVLTSDMAYVINGGDRPTEKFQKFVDLCCQAFNIVRNNGNLFLYLVTFMAASGVKGLTTEAVAYLHRALMPGKSNPDAAASFTRLIESSLNSVATQVNFFIHNIAAQLKSSNDQSSGELLSFIPNRYSVESDGKLNEVRVIGYKKCYDPDKYYVYILEILRINVRENSRVLRTYKEFCELHQKLCMTFPLAKVYSLSTGLQMGRSNIKQVAEKRLRDITLFLKSLFLTADEIAHSDLVYTFFHPLLRDQQLFEHLSTKKKDRWTEAERADIGKVKGQLKLSLLYTKGGVFTIMVQHVRGLGLMPGGHPPSTYVKVYLMPDPTKTTKRKTKVVRRNCHPSFMEMLEYRMPLDVIHQRTLKVTIWHSDALQENEFLGGVEFHLADLDLTREITEWYPLTNVTR